MIVRKVDRLLRTNLRRKLLYKIARGNLPDANSVFDTEMWQFGGKTMMAAD